LFFNKSSELIDIIQICYDKYKGGSCRGYKAVKYYKITIELNDFIIISAIPFRIEKEIIIFCENHFNIVDNDKTIIGSMVRLNGSMWNITSIKFIKEVKL